MKVKICGISDLRSAQTSVKAGADFAGFIFIDGVRRQISLDSARDVIRELRPASTKIVGLFANQKGDWVNRVSHEVGLDYVQLCGQEDDACMSEIDFPIIRQLRVAPTKAPGEIKSIVLRYLDAGYFVALDGKVPNALGGTGKVWNWEIACEVFGLDGVLLAGGLTSRNLRDAVNCCKKGDKPWGVDVSSGVETHGVKDVAKIETFVKTAKLL